MSSKNEPPDLNEKLPPQVAAQLEKRLIGAIDAAQAAGSTKELAKGSRQRAAETTDPTEQRKAENEATELEKTAKYQMKMANRLGSGAWQGAGAGVGIGIGTSMGVGTVVGTVVSGVMSIPTTVLGGLIGAGTGAIHGPWVRCTEKVEAAQGQDVRGEDIQARGAVGEVVEGQDMHVDGNYSTTRQTHDSSTTDCRGRKLASLACPESTETSSSSLWISPSGRNRTRVLELESFGVL